MLFSLYGEVIVYGKDINADAKQFKYQQKELSH